MKKMKMFLAGFLAMSLLVSCSDGEDDPTPGSEPVPPAPGEKIIAIDMNLDLDGVTIEKETVDTGYNVTLTFDSSNAALAPADGEMIKLIYPEVTFADGIEGVTFVTEDGPVAISEETGFVAVEGKANTFKVEFPLIDSRVLAQMGTELTSTFKKEGAKDTVVTITLLDTSYVEPPAADSIRTYAGADDTRTEFMIYNVKDLEKASELVNGGDTFAGKTLKVANDITINESVLKEGFLEPDEGEGATANPDLVNLDSIGKKDATFNGTFDGNGKVISGLYIYQGHQGLAFIGATGEGAVVKNLTIVDACVVNKNVETSVETGSSAGTNEDGTSKMTHDGHDDDRFGGLVGINYGATTIENCVFIGVVGSEAAKGRKTDENGNACTSTPYEYAAGLIGRCDAACTVTNCTILERNYASAHKTAQIGNASAKIAATDTVVLSATSATLATDYTGDNQYVKDAIAALTAQ